MVRQDQQELVTAAEQRYATKLKAQPEPTHDGEFIVIEPVSGEYFLGKTLCAAIQAARRNYPTRLPYAVRVGADPSIHLGTW